MLPTQANKWGVSGFTCQQRDLQPPHTSQPRRPRGLSWHAGGHIYPLLMFFINYAEILTTA